MSHRSSSKFPTINNWKVRVIFGTLVLIGYIRGERFTPPLLWASHGNFGVRNGDSWHEQSILKMGRPAYDCWGLS